VRVARTATLYSELFETTTAKQKGEPSAPLFAFWRGQKLPARSARSDCWVLRTLFIELEFDANDDAKPGGGDAGPSPNAGGGAGRAMKRDLLSAARQDEPSLGQGQTPTGAVLRIVS
jgi:hypothetical protein